MSKSVVFTIFIWAVILISDCTKLPSHVLKCDRKASTFNECLAKSTEEVLKILQNPIPELGLPSFNPFEKSSLMLPVSEKHPMEQKFFDIKIWGFTNSKILKFIIDLEAKSVFVECFLPTINAEMAYEFDGIFFGEKINKVKGNFKFTYTNILNNMTATIEEYDKNGKKHIKVIGESNIVSSEKIVYNINSEDEAMGEHLTKVYNEHYNTIKADTDYAYDRFWLEMFIGSFNTVASIIPVSDLF